ncbi:conserved hypothetical protein [Roseobacter sp. GAI101]|nr:conserved hypothetical protein [Roseobacter sp. GAI101]
MCFLATKHCEYVSHKRILILAKEVIMSSLPKPPFLISARFLGPVFTFDGELTKESQNLIFARNGTGKSFISRAFRCLDLYGGGVDVINAPRNLVSDESKDGKGQFSFSCGSKILGAMTLNKIDDTFIAQTNDTIFHVFSEDFVQEELREKEYKLDGKIENVISIDSDNIKLKDAQDTANLTSININTEYKKLNDKFEQEKSDELNLKAGINKQLGDYKKLSFPSLLESFVENPNELLGKFKDILKDLDALKSIPAEPLYPIKASILNGNELNLVELEAVVSKITSASSVAASIKNKIDAHHSFFEIGIKIIENKHSAECPFCEQDLTNPEPKSVVDAYIQYFNDAEEKHKSELRQHYSILNVFSKEIEKLDNDLMRQRSRFDDLKLYLTSQKYIDLENHEDPLYALSETISKLKLVVENKASNLTVSNNFSDQKFLERLQDLNTIIEENNIKVINLNKAIEKSDDERKLLQRNACSAFEREFATSNWDSIENLRTLQKASSDAIASLQQLEKSSPSKEARSRVAETFELLLRDFFGDKYVFDKDGFVLKHKDREMDRGPHRTLSDGEKTAIAFCYFIACSHRKVTANSDYANLYFVFDDPVTSMSYDFVFSIAQTLKNMSISKLGEISINPNFIDGNKYIRPRLLILTHSSYFFNISLTNRVVKGEAAFTLFPDMDVHKMAKTNKYIAPFQEQLKHVQQVANGAEPNYSTGNAIRSVLEAVGRFCCPDKSESLTIFIQHLAGEENISLKSVMINSLCHGTYYDETPPPNDISLACKETITVVDRYAKGQLNILL